MNKFGDVLLKFTSVIIVVPVLFAESIPVKVILYVPPLVKLGGLDNVLSPEFSSDPDKVIWILEAAASVLSKSTLPLEIFSLNV